MLLVNESCFSVVECYYVVKLFILKVIFAWIILAVQQFKQLEEYILYILSSIHLLSILYAERRYRNIHDF